MIFSPFIILPGFLDSPTNSIERPPHAGMWRVQKRVHCCHESFICSFRVFFPELLFNLLLVVLQRFFSCTSSFHPVFSSPDLPPPIYFSARTTTSKEVFFSFMSPKVPFSSRLIPAVQSCRLNPTSDSWNSRLCRVPPLRFFPWGGFYRSICC